MSEEKQVKRGRPGSGDANDRSAIGRLGAHTKWARTADRRAATQPMRDAQRAKLARELDPEGVLTVAELDKRIEHAQRARMIAMTRRSVEVRRRNAEQAAAYRKMMADE